MSYRVEWSPAAEQDLARLWLAASDRSAVTAAVHRIDTLLASAPLVEGESRFGRTRIFFAPPLVLYYDVWENSRRVWIWSVWRRTAKS